MKRSSTLFLYLLLGLYLGGCNIFDSDKKSDSVYLRVSNTGTVDFDSVYIQFPGAESTFQNVKSGNVSSYKKLESAYRYGYIEVKAEEGVYYLQPIDYVGEKPLNSGRYTFKLKIENDLLSFNFMKD